MTSKYLRMNLDVQTLEDQIFEHFLDQFEKNEEIRALIYQAIESVDPYYIWEEKEFGRLDDDVLEFVFVRLMKLDGEAVYDDLECALRKYNYIESIRRRKN